MISLEDGKKLVKLARNSVWAFFEKKEIKYEKFLGKRGVFVSLHIYPSNALRGCIGFIEPELMLSEAVIEVARNAAFGDPRFLPLHKEELKKVIFEISVLTEPCLVKDFREIKINRDGLIIEARGKKGLLLPQVFKDESIEEALKMTARKAGLPDLIWKEKDCKIYRFECQLFKEEKPNGAVVEKRFC